MNDLEQRRVIAQAAVDRFKGEPLIFGKNDCVRIGAFVLRKRGWRPQLGKAGAYSSLLGATRALQRAGFETLSDALDAQGLARIPPAAALPADLILIPGEAFGGALMMAVGNGRVLGYHQDLDHAEILQPVEYVGAWRV